MNNIVIFGPVHSGKTTLAGYISSYYMSEEEFQKKENKIKSILEEKNLPFKMSDRFTYFISMDDDELIRDYNKDPIGTTKRIHMKHVPYRDQESVIDITYIETPGSNTQKLWKHRYEGIFMGEIGIFVIDINELIKLSLLEIGKPKYKQKVNELFAALFLWCSFKSEERLIIAISKTENSSLADIRCAVDSIRAIKRFQNMKILPIGIDIKQRESSNIFDNKRCKKRIQEQYAPLMNVIARMAVKEDKHEKDGMKFAYINGDSDFVENQLVIKTLNGSFLKGERVKIYPVKKSEYGRKSEAELKIASISGVDDDSNEYTEIGAGKIAVIKASAVSWNGYDDSLDKLNLSQASLLLGMDTKYKEANFLLFRTKKSNSNTFQEKYMALKPGQKICIVWFGKVINTILLSLYYEEDVFKIGLYVYNDSVVMPLDKNSNEYNLPYKNFTLEIEHSYFFDAELMSMDLYEEDEKNQYYYGVILRQESNEKIEKELQNIKLMFGIDNAEKEEWNFMQIKEIFKEIGGVLSKNNIVNYDLRLYKY